MDSNLKSFLESGKHLIGDTKKILKKKQLAPEPLGTQQVELDPHRAFVKNAIQSKPKKAEIVEDFKKFIQLAEDDL